jgi:GNAT superfamily N-acetyltransferase
MKNPHRTRHDTGGDFRGNPGSWPVPIIGGDDKVAGTFALVSTPDITFQLLDGTQAAADAAELQALHAEVYADPPYRRNDDAALFEDRFRVQRRQPGFVLAEARHGGYLVGYAAGMPLRPSTSWWRDLTTPLPDEVTAEHPGRTFAVTELLVRASWRRQGIGQTLHDLILGNRREERATLTVLPAATPAQSAFQKWGWRKVARARDPRPGSPVLDVLVTALPANHEERRGRG